jgi:hypothetical protein
MLPIHELRTHPTAVTAAALCTTALGALVLVLAAHVAAWALQPARMAAPQAGPATQAGACPAAQPAAPQATHQAAQR